MVCPGNLRVWKNNTDLVGHETETKIAAQLALQTEAEQMCEGLKELHEAKEAGPKLYTEHNEVTLEGVNARVNQLDEKLDAISQIFRSRSKR